MRKFFADLTNTLTDLCPTFLHLPPDPPYPHITLEDINSLIGIPAGPTLVSFSLKIWSQYAGTKEIFHVLQDVETFIRGYQGSHIKVIKSFLALLPDAQTRVHTLQIKARVPHE